MSPAERPLGLFGGTFDPIHHGHLRLAETALAALGLGALRFIPAGQPPHRSQPGANGQHRLAMVRLAIAGKPDFQADPAEVEARQASYTILTLERLRREVGPHRPLVLLLGVDAFLGLPSWWRWEELTDFAHLAVANRPGYSLDQAALPDALAALLRDRGADMAALGASPHGALVQFSMPPQNISATEIRRRVAAREDLRDLLPPPVLDYISVHQLYL